MATCKTVSAPVNAVAVTSPRYANCAKRSQYHHGMHPTHPASTGLGEILGGEGAGGGEVGADA